MFASPPRMGAESSTWPVRSFTCMILLWMWRPQPIDFRSSRAERKRRFVDAAEYLQGYSIHPEGHSLALVCRGKPYVLGNWEGPVVQHGQPQAVRYRLAAWMADGQRLAVVSDALGEETLEIHKVAGSGHNTLPTERASDEEDVQDADVDRLAGLDLGRPIDLLPAPFGNLVALSNHRHELIVVDLAARTSRVLDRSHYDLLQGRPGLPTGMAGVWLPHGPSDNGHQAGSARQRRDLGGHPTRTPRREPPRLTRQVDICTSFRLATLTRSMTICIST